MMRSLLALILTLATWFVPFGLFAQERSADGEIRTILVPTGSQSAADVAKVIERAFAGQIEMTVTPVVPQSLLVIRTAEARQDEIMELVKTLTTKEALLRIRLMVLQSTSPLTNPERDKLSGPIAAVSQAIHDLTHQSRLEWVNDMELTLVANHQSQVRIGDQVSVKTGSTQVGPGRNATQYQSIQLGSLLSIMATPSDDAISVDLSFEKSFQRASDSQDDSDAAPGAVATLSHESTSRVSDGHAQIVGRISDRSPTGQIVTQLLILSAEKL